MVNPSFGPEGLRLLRQGGAPRDIVQELLTADGGREMRQLAVLDAAGRVAAFTGDRCVPACGHIEGEGFSVQANMMASEEVWPTMARAFTISQGPLAERLVSALEAAQSVGGDFRGSQSAALLVVRATPTGKIWEDRAIDLRVEDHPRPVAEMRRLLQVHRAYESMNNGDLAIEKGDMAEALRQYEAAQERYPDNEEMVFWRAAMLASNGRLEEALPLFVKVFARNDNWRRAVPAMARLGHLKLTPEQVRTIVEL
jgi:uncharacterized Ntn-hydrolase superfamily protein